MRQLLWITAALSVTTAFADGIRIGNPTYGGTGCPQGSASATLSPDGKSLSILFDSYIAEAGYTTGRTIDRKSCNFAIPVHVPQGMSISLVKVDYRGFNALPEGATSRFSTNYFFAGQRGVTFQEDFHGPINEDFITSNDLTVEGQIWSSCGEDANLRVNSNMMVKTNDSFDQTLGQVDTVDLKAGIIYQIQWKRCDGR